MTSKVDLTTELWFGKYKGYLLLNVINSDVTYVRWAIDEGVLELDDVAFLYFNEIIEDHENEKAINDGKNY